jgi:hypothetical protein
MSWRLLNYSICLAIQITATAYGLRALDRLLLPGLVGEVMINGLFLFISTGDEYLSLPHGSHLFLNVAIYDISHIYIPFHDYDNSERTKVGTWLGPLTGPETRPLPA